MTQVDFLLENEQQDFLFSAKTPTTNFIFLLHEIGQDGYRTTESVLAFKLNKTDD